MTHWWTRAGFALALGVGLVALAPADDEKKTDEKKDEAKPTSSSSASKGPDWSGFIRVSQVTAEVVKADDSSVTLRLYMLAAKQSKGSARPRPQLHLHGHNYQNPLMRRPSSGNRTQVYWDHHDYTVQYAPEGLARTHTLPPKTDENGKKAAYTQKELEDLKAPVGAPGYAIAKSDLAPGSIVDVILIREKSIAADKVTEADLRIKYATVTGAVPSPAKDTTPAPNAKKKKN